MTLTVGFTFATVNSPVVVAVVMDVTLAVEEETIFTVFLSQGSVCTLVEGIAACGMGIHLEAFFLRAFVVAKPLGCGCRGRGTITAKPV